MAFGLPNTDGGTGGEFLGRLQYDARVGFWKIVKRVQGPDGYANEEGQPFQGATFAVDFGCLEVGYSKIASPPVFIVVPFGQAIPPQPDEMGTPDPKTGKTTKAFKPCFRVKVVSSKTFGDGDAYYFSSNSKNVLGAVDGLHELYRISPEAALGKIPVVQSARSVAIKTTNAKTGTSTFYAPEFQIMQWVDRPGSLGDRTVPPPSGRAPVHQTAPAPASASTSTNGRHVGPPAQAPQATAAQPAMADADDDLPF